MLICDDGVSSLQGIPAVGWKQDIVTDFEVNLLVLPGRDAFTDFFPTMHSQNALVLNCNLTTGLADVTAKVSPLLNTNAYSDTHTALGLAAVLSIL